MILKTRASVYFLKKFSVL